MYLFELKLQIFPYILKHLSKQDVLVARLACKSWNLAIDRYIENYTVAITDEKTIRKEQTGVSVPLELLWKNSPYLNFQSVFEVEKFFKVMTNCSGNPFFGRTIEIGITWLPYGENESNYYFQVKKLLDKFGKYIRHLSVVLRLEDIETYEYFLTWLLKVPNVQSLRVRGSWNNNKAEICVDKRLFYMRLPTLVSLHTLNIKCDELNKDVCFALLYKYQLNLKTLCFPLDILRHLPNHIMKCKNLTKLVCFNVTSCIRLLKMYKSHFGCTAIRIQKLELHVDIRLDMNDVCEILDELRIPVVEIRTNRSNYTGLLTSFNFKSSIQFEFLTSLTISDSVELNYKFLEYLSCLEYLCLLPIWSDNDEIRRGNEMGGRVSCPLDVIIWRCLYVRGLPTQILWKTLTKLNIFCVSRQIKLVYHLRQFLRAVYKNLPDRYFVKPFRCPCTQPHLIS